LLDLSGDALDLQNFFVFVLRASSNLTHHLKDFGLEAGWLFFPTSHGKGACDGLQLKG